MTDPELSEKMKELNKNLKPKEEKMAEKTDSQADLTKQLDTILANLRDVISKTKG